MTRIAVPEEVTPKTLRLATWNVKRDRRPGDVIDQLMDVLNEFKLHAIFLQETRDYFDQLDGIPGYDAFGAKRPRGADQQVTLVRSDVKTNGGRVIQLGGDGWTTVDGHHHVGSCAFDLTLAGWLRTLNLHLPVSINWPGGKITGPPERVDDYIANARKLVRWCKARPGGKCLVGDWNARPGRDEGDFTPSWIAREAGMRKPAKSIGAAGHLHGIDFPMVDRGTRLTEQRQRGRYGSDHPLVTFKATRIAK